MKLHYNAKNDVYGTLDGWEVEKSGGFITIPRWEAYHKKTETYFWQATKKSVVLVLEQLEQGKSLEQIFGNYHKLFTKPIF